MSWLEQLDETVRHPVVLAFLRDIKTNLDDPTPRLILADWLEEHGDTVGAARGDFLRLQCHGTHTPNSPRQAELLARFETAWLGPLKSLAHSWSWHRGMLHLEIHASVLRGDAGALVPPEAFAWVEGVTFRDLTAETVSRLAASPWLVWLSTLDMGYNVLGDAGVAALASSPNLTNLRTLWLRRNNIGDRGAAALAASTALTNLETLSLIDNEVGDDGGRALASSPLLAHLTLVNLEGNRLSQTSIAALKKAALPHRRLWLHVGRQEHSR
jgi:uncharacterized protein (TIGR02996 family)